jgi:Domain of unknown function (DUF4340)
MSLKNTSVWLLLAGGLFAFIYFFHPHREPPAGPAPILPRLQPNDITSIQVRPAGPAQLQIVAERTNGTWQLLDPLVYRADSEKIETLLQALAQLTPATYITPEEVRRRPDADAEYGFATPQASLIITQGNYRAQILIGATTPPGDQVFLQVVSHQGIYVVDADLIKLIPRAANDWRDRSLFAIDSTAFDRVAVTNAPKEPGTAGATFIVQRDSPSSLWRLVWPFTRGARADNARIDKALQQLLSLKATAFYSDSAGQDLEALGLAHPDLQVALSQGTNTLALLQVGNSPTNDAALVYARYAGHNTIFTVPKNPLGAFQRPSLNDFRDPHLLTLTEPVRTIEVRGLDTFRLQSQTNGPWRILPEQLSADTFAVSHLLFMLTNMPILQFTKDIVNEPDLPQFGLSKPLREYLLFGNNTNAPPLADLCFGLGTNGQCFARRTDESSVYAVSSNEVARLPALSWGLRDHQLFHFSDADLAGVTLRQNGRVRRLLRRGEHRWSLAPGSQGVINDLAVEQTVRGLAQVSALAWVARGQTNLARCGFSEKGYEITFDLLDGQKTTLRFGGVSQSGAPYAALDLDGQPWICVLPADLYAQIEYCLAVP